MQHFRLKFTYKIIFFNYILKLFIIDYFQIAFQEPLSKRYNKIDFCVIFKYGFNFKINEEFFKVKWESLTAVPTI